jgi:hypothetical protein
VEQVQVRSGETGNVRTVVRSGEFATFDVKVLARMEGSGPIGTDSILVRASGPLIEELGGLAQGMSGSPVFVNDRIIGAIAFGFDNDLTLGLVTPLEEMLAIRPGGAGGPGLHPLLPLACAGFRSTRAMKRVRRRLDRPVIPAIPGPPTPGGADAEIVPGSPVAVGLVTGDLQVGGIGTATFVQDGTVWAFGHSFLFLGPVQFPLLTAEVFETTRGHVPLSPFKLGRMRNPVGTILEDRATAVVGRLGPLPVLAPLSFTVADLDRGVVETLNVQAVRHPHLLSELTAVVGLETWDRALNRRGGGIAHVRFRVVSPLLEAPVQRELIVFDETDIAVAALRPLLEVIAALAEGRTVEVPLDLLLYTAEVERDGEAALLTGAELAAERLRRGREARVAAVLRMPDGETARVEIALPVPLTFPEGPALLLLSPGGQELTVRLEAERGGDSVEQRIAMPLRLWGEPVLLPVRVSASWL